MSADTYLDLALLPDVEGLAELVLGQVAVHGSLPVYERLLQPALEEVGRRWENDELTVADEHLVTALTEQVLTRVRHRPTSGPMAIIACTPGNEHRVGAVMVSDALGMAGWSSMLLGARTPFEDLASLSLARDAQLVALSVGIEEELGVVGPQLERLRLRVGPDVPVIVGGGALRRQSDWHPPAGVTVCTSVLELLTEESRTKLDRVLAAPRKGVELITVDGAVLDVTAVEAAEETVLLVIRDVSRYTAAATPNSPWSRMSSHAGTATCRPSTRSAPSSARHSTSRNSARRPVNSSASTSAPRR